jgi:hypothetical protein
VQFSFSTNTCFIRERKFLLSTQTTPTRARGILMHVSSLPGEYGCIFTELTPDRYALLKRASSRVTERRRRYVKKEPRR